MRGCCILVWLLVLPNIASAQSAGRVGQVHYVYRDPVGTRGSWSHADTLSTVDFTEEQIREWLADKEVEFPRWATFPKEGYTETVKAWRYPAPFELEYVITDAKGSRSSRNRGSVLATLKMSVEEIWAWAASREEAALAERRIAGVCEPVDEAERFTVSDALGTRSGRDESSVQSTLAMTEKEIRKWVASVENRDPGEQRTATFPGNEYNEIVDHNPAGKLRYHVVKADDLNRVTWANRASALSRQAVLRTPEMSPAELIKWVENSVQLDQQRWAEFSSGKGVEIVTTIPQPPDVQVPTGSR